MTTMQRRMIRTRKQLYSTGEVAQLCEVAPRTAAKWIDSGALPGFRLPESRDRRVKHADLVAFMRAHEFPLDALGVIAGPAVVVATADSRFADELQRRATGMRLQFGQTLFEAGYFAPGAAVMVLDFALGRFDSLVVAALQFGEAHRPALIAVACEDEANPGDLLAKGFIAAFKRPFDVAGLVAKVEELAAGAVQ